MDKWYALCYYDKVGRKKKPRQIKAHRDISVLEDLKERLIEQGDTREFAIKSTLEFDKEMK